MPMTRAPRHDGRPGRFRFLVPLCAAACATGCVTSEKAPYARHLSNVTAPRTPASDDVAMAFGLDDYAAPRMAAVDPGGPVALYGAP